MTITIEQSIRRIKEEITADIKDGTVPVSISSFAKLHDFVDANEYGGFCDNMDTMAEQYGGRDRAEAIPDGLIAHWNAAQTAVDVWLAAGRPNG